MTKFTLLSTILFLVPFATCHFELKYPPSRAGDDSEKQGTFPCGGYDTVKDRTQFPLSDGSIQLELGHDRSLVQVLLALGNEPGDSFNIVWKPIVQQEGPGEFCLQDLDVPASLNIENGQNATIQVITDGHDNTGLYNCADITFTNGSISGTPPPCRNGTNVRASAYTGEFTNANGTTSGNGSPTTESESAASSTASEGASTDTGAAGKIEGGVWAVLGALAVGGLTLL